MTHEIGLRIYLLCMSLIGLRVAIFLWQSERQAGSGWSFLILMCGGGFIWGCLVAFLFTMAALAVVAGACFIFLGHVPIEIKSMIFP